MLLLADLLRAARPNKDWAATPPRNVPLPLVLPQPTKRGKFLVDLAGTAWSPTPSVRKRAVVSAATLTEEEQNEEQGQELRSRGAEVASVRRRPRLRRVVESSKDEEENLSVPRYK